MGGRSIDENENGLLYYQTVNGNMIEILSISITQILKIENIPFDPQKETETVSWLNSDTKQNYEILEEQLKEYEYPNIKLLPISFISLALSIDYFIQANDLSDEISILNDLNTDGKSISDEITKLKNRRTEKYIICSAILVGAILNTYFALEKVQIHTTQNTVGLAFKF